MVAKIKREFHSRVSTANDKHSLAAETVAGSVITSMHNMSTELLQPFKFRHYFLGILSGSHDQPPANIFELAGTRSGGRNGVDAPQTECFIVLSRLNGLIELRVYSKVFGVGFQVANELVFGWIFREILWNRTIGQLAKLLWKMKLQPVIGSVLPQRSNAIRSFKHHEWDTLLFQTPAHR